MVVNNLYQAKASDVAADMEFSDDFIAQILHDIYRRGKAQSSTDLSPELFRAILRRFNEATAEGINASAAPDQMMISARHSNTPMGYSLPSRCIACSRIWSNSSPIQTVI